MNESKIKQSYDAARELYGELGVDTEKALAGMEGIGISIHCWQGDDVTGFENSGPLTGGILATGNYPGKARTPDELRADFEKAYSLIPGTHRFNLHASYLENDGARIDRNEIEPKHFSGWIDWAKQLGIALDFNPTFFSHPKSDDGFTLAHRDKAIRDFWIDHGRRSRLISAEMGRRLGTPSIDNFWIPDGWKDQPADRLVHRELLVESLDAIFAEELEPEHTLDAVESKLFGIAS
ncbi:MAG: L-rhamnose isomerase, partial [Spirochaetota bacterium]